MHTKNYHCENYDSISPPFLIPNSGLLLLAVAVVYLFGQAVVAKDEVQQTNMAINSSGVVGGYGGYDGDETEKSLGKGTFGLLGSRSMVYFRLSTHRGR